MRDHAAQPKEQPRRGSVPCPLRLAWRQDSTGHIPNSPFEAIRFRSVSAPVTQVMPRADNVRPSLLRDELLCRLETTAGPIDILVRHVLPVPLFRVSP